MLVNNAGIVTGKKILDTPDHLMVKTMEVNSISHFWVRNIFCKEISGICSIIVYYIKCHTRNNNLWFSNIFLYFFYKEHSSLYGWY